MGKPKVYRAMLVSGNLNYPPFRSSPLGRRGLRRSCLGVLIAKVLRKLRPENLELGDRQRVGALDRARLATTSHKPSIGNPCACRTGVRGVDLA